VLRLVTLNFVENSPPAPLQSPRTAISRTRLFKRLYVFMRMYRTALIGKYFVTLYEKDGARVLQTRFRSFHCQEVALAGFLSSR
jgi:hypothetical protein